MKLLKLFILLAMFSTMVACGDDDDDCVQSDWVGTYSGTVVCSDGAGNDDTEDVTVTITASGSDQVVIISVTPSIETEYDPLNFNGCDISNSGEDGGITISFDADLDGDNLELTEAISDGTFTSTCVTNATRN